MSTSIRRLAIPILIALGLATYTYALGGCAPTLTPAEQLATAVQAAHRAAATATHEMAREAARARSAQGRQGLASDALLDSELAQLATASKRYEALVSEGRWTERIVPLLREAVDAYIRLRELGLPLPPVPAIVLDLLHGECS